MNQTKAPMILKCCVCGRVQSDTGWQYHFIPIEDGWRVSHGFCEVCYEAEMMKMQWETNCAASARSQQVV